MKVLRLCALALIVAAALSDLWHFAPAPAAISLSSSQCAAFSTGLAVPFSTSRADRRVPVVSVCIDGHGPYPFVVSSGEGVSIVSPRLARTLRLHPIPALVPVLGVTCVATSREVLLQKWSMGGLGLASQGVVVARVPSESLRPWPMGVIGSDVLSRFQAVRVDYRSRRLRMEYAESPAPTSTAFVVGNDHTKPPATLIKGAARLSVPLTVLTGLAGTTISVAVTFRGSPAGTTPLSFTVDSGSARSSVVPSVATRFGLSGADGMVPSWGAGCRGTAHEVRSGSWSVDKVSLPAQRLSLVTIAGGVNQALGGVLGANVLGLAGSYVIDYQHAHLWIGGRA